MITISVPSLWNFSQSSLPSSVTLGSSTIPSSSGWSARSGRIGCNWWAATDARTTSSAVVYGVPSCKWWCGCGGNFGNKAPGYKCGWWPDGELANAAKAAAWKYGWCGWLNGFGCGLHAEFEAICFRFCFCHSRRKKKNTWKYEEKKRTILNKSNRLRFSASCRLLKFDEQMLNLNEMWLIQSHFDHI